jgi:hypothetical protein
LKNAVARELTQSDAMSSNLKRFRTRRFITPLFAGFTTVSRTTAFLDSAEGPFERVSPGGGAARVGTTQSAIARLESGARKHSPSIATLQRYARALGYRVEIRLVKARRQTDSRE